MHPAFARISHRPWPIPRRPWFFRQRWEDLLFAHWPVPVKALRDLVPRELEIEEFDGTSWIGIVPFRMSGVMLRGFPDMPWISAFPELNVRLYVRRDGFRGVWFLSLDAANILAVRVARTFFHLPYHHARFDVRSDGDAVLYRSQRRSGVGETFEGRYAPSGEVFAAQEGTLEHFLTERYCLYARRPDGAILRTDIQHVPWPLQPAEAQIERNEMAFPSGIPLAGAPILHFARSIDVVIWNPQLVSAAH